MAMTVHETVWALVIVGHDPASVIKVSSGRRYRTRKAAEASRRALMHPDDWRIWRIDSVHTVRLASGEEPNDAD